MWSYLLTLFFFSHRLFRLMLLHHRRQHADNVNEYLVSSNVLVCRAQDIQKQHSSLLQCLDEMPLLLFFTSIHNECSVYIHNWHSSGRFSGDEHYLLIELLLIIRIWYARDAYLFHLCSLKLIFKENHQFFLIISQFYCICCHLFRNSQH